MTDINTQASIFAKIATITGEVDTFSKDSEFGGRGSWKYASAAQVFSVISKAMAKHNLACIPQIIEKRETSLYSHENGKSAQRVEAVFTMVLACGDTGATYNVRWENEVVRYNNDDKVMNKLTTISLKYFLMSLFVTSQGESDENSTVPPQDVRQPPHWTETNAGDEVRAKLKQKRQEHGDDLMDKVIGVVGDMKSYDTKGAYFYALGNAFEQERDDTEPEPVPEDTPRQADDAPDLDPYVGKFVIDLFKERAKVTGIHGKQPNTVSLRYPDGSIKHMTPQQFTIDADQSTPLVPASEDATRKDTPFRKTSGSKRAVPATDEIPF